jgi:hypothetical protein
VSPFKSQFGTQSKEFLMVMEEYEKYDLIKKTCKDTTKNVHLGEMDSDEIKKGKNNFITRMMIDVYLRDNRDKNFDEIKHVVAMKTTIDHDSISRSASPRKDRS